MEADARRWEPKREEVDVDIAGIIIESRAANIVKTFILNRQVDDDQKVMKHTRSCGHEIIVTLLGMLIVIRGS